MWMNPPINFYVLLKQRVSLLHFALHVVLFSRNCFQGRIDHFVPLGSFLCLSLLQFLHISEEYGSQFHYSDILHHSTWKHVRVKLSIRKILTEMEIRCFEIIMKSLGI